ncbi:hypothetical protein D3C85_869630 [compost metagenome]
MHHQRLGEDRGEDQRHHGNDHRAPAAEGDQAQQGHRRIHVEQHLAVGFLDHDVGRRIDTGVAGGQQELPILGTVFLGKLLGHIQQAIQGGRLVVGQIGEHRGEAAVGIEELGVPGHRIADLRVDDPLVVADGGPFRVALEHPGGVGAHRIGKGRRALHARHLGQRPAQTVDFSQGFIAAAAIVARFHHHREDVAGDRVVGGDEGVVLVVARVRS